VFGGGSTAVVAIGQAVPGAVINGEAGCYKGRPASCFVVKAGIFARDRK